MSNHQSSNHRSLTGFVTKLVGDGATYGFIDDEIFFPQTNVSGGPAAVGDQVFAECEFSAHLPIKWNATSVKILNKALRQQHQSNSSSTSQQQGLMSQQFNQTGPIANTYQQHRQQRQRQVNEPKQSEIKQQPQQSIEQHPPRLLDGNQGDFYASNNPRPFAQQPPQQQQQDTNIQPFQDQPMGPPNFTYTSQLGSAFVQNQFVPAPFMTQQTLLPPPQQQQSQQNLLPINQMHNQNQRHNQHNKNMGSRFNNHGDKNERQNNRRNNNNKNDSKFDRSRSGDRDGSQNNRSTKSKDSRERSLGRGVKRDDLPIRASPPLHSSARSTTSSDRGSKSRRHYDIHNIPKAQIMVNINPYNIKQRCPSSIHVPSDLKDIIVNKYFRLDIKNTPKPILYTIEQPKKENIVSQSKDMGVDESKDDELMKTEETQEKDTVAILNEETSTGNLSKQQEVIAEGSNCSNEVKNEVKSDVKTNEEPTPPSSRSDQKLNHKYGVKVILFSLPELDTIYQSIFGPNLDSFNIDNGKSRTQLENAIYLLCNKGSNNGYSLIGGKFDSTIDGFLEGEHNELERHSRQPDLIATCKRVVMEQTGIDLGQCKSWTLLSTFMYNHKSDYFTSKASIEYSFIYMPQVWTMLSDSFDKTVLNQEPVSSDVPLNTQDVKLPEPTKELSDINELSVAQNTAAETEEQEVPASSVTSEAAPTVSIDSLSDLKVTDLKMELDKRDIKYKNGAKKAELVSLLYNCLQPNQASTDCVELTKQEVAESQLEEGEVEADPSEDSPEEVESDSVSGSGSKRKNDEPETDEHLNKKICSSSRVKEERVELIRDSFIVRARGEQQRLSLVSLHEVCQASKYDQFELSVSSNILKESLIQHFSEYILTTLIEDNRQRMQPSNPSTSSSSSSQEANSDTNNNSAKFKNPTTVEQKNNNLKEFPVDRYINLAFSYFDSSHTGYIYFEDLNKLFNNTGLTISKRALMSLVNDSDKVNYRTLPDLSPKLPPTYIYEFPEQFKRLPGSPHQAQEVADIKTAVKSVEYKGVTYDVEKLIQQVKDSETLRVSLVDRFNYAITNSDKQAEEIHVLEVSQKSLAKAIKAQNDEICDLKRERDCIKKKHENVRKGVKGAVSTLSELVKDDK